MKKELKKPIGGARKSVVVALALCVLLFTGGCTAPFTQINFDVREAYRSPNVEGGYDFGTMAILSANGGSDGIVEYRKLLVDILYDVLAEKRPGQELKSYWETISTLNKEGLTGDYAAMLKQYSTTGVLDRDVLIEMGETLGVKHFLHPRLVSFSKHKEGRFGALGLSLIKTHETVVKLYIEIWDAETGEIDWVGIGEANIASESYKAKAIPFEDVVRIAIMNMLEEMP